MVVASDIIELFESADISIDTSIVAEDEPLRTYGVDSMDVAVLILQVERRYGLTVSPAQSNGLRSLRDFVELVNGVTGR
jgi:acyl carrier protein